MLATGSYKLFFLVSDIGDTGVDSGLAVDEIGLLYDMSFLDDSGRSRLCLNSTTGDFIWTILSGPGAGTTYTGNAIVKNLSLDSYSMLLVNNKLGDPFVLRFSFNKTLNSASGYYKLPSSATSYLADTDTTNDPPGCF